MGTYYDKDGSPLDLYAWAELHEDFGYRLIASDSDGRWRVSTVWLGLNHEWDEGKPPLIFESMVFPADEDDFTDHDCLRYSTLEEAEAGHAELVRRWLETPSYDEPDPED